MSDGGTPREYVGIGPVRARVLELLREGVEGEFAATIAHRSPVGPGAVRLQSSGLADDELARWLEQQPWTDALATRPTHVYVRVGAEALREWVGAGFAGPRAAAGEEGDGRLAVVRVADPEPAPPRSLDVFRELVVSRSLAALLASRGFEVRLEAEEPHPTCAVLLGDELVATPVGGIDVRHGPLRARHGGSVSADDLLGEVRERLGAPGEGYAEGLLAFLLLRTERARRVQLDDAKLGSETAAFDSVLAARAVAAGEDPAPDPAPAAEVHGPAAADRSSRVNGTPTAGDAPIRDLAVELDLLPTVAARAAQALEPALMARCARSIAERAHAARAHLPAGDPVWPTVEQAIGSALGLAGIDLVQDLQCAA